MPYDLRNPGQLRHSYSMLARLTFDALPDSRQTIAIISFLGARLFDGQQTAFPQATGRYGGDCRGLGRDLPGRLLIVVIGFPGGRWLVWVAAACPVLLV
jgi:hypothetical protein